MLLYFVNLDGICEVDCTIQGCVINAILFCRHHGKGDRQKGGSEKCKCNWLKLLIVLNLSYGCICRVGNNCESFLL